MFWLILFHGVKIEEDKLFCLLLLLNVRCWYSEEVEEVAAGGGAGAVVSGGETAAEWRVDTGETQSLTESQVSNLSGPVLLLHLRDQWFGRFSQKTTRMEIFLSKLMIKPR